MCPGLTEVMDQGRPPEPVPLLATDMRRRDDPPAVLTQCLM
jgi:hypothetical protein